LPFGAKEHEHHTMAIGTLEKTEGIIMFIIFLLTNKYNKWRDWLVHHPLS
jgi:hypothetical protein